MKKLLVILLLSLAIPLCAMMNDSREYGIPGLSGATAQDDDGSRAAAAAVLASPGVKNLRRRNSEQGDFGVRESADGLVPAAQAVESSEDDERTRKFKLGFLPSSSPDQGAGTQEALREAPFPTEVEVGPSGSEADFASSGDDEQDDLSPAISSAPSPVAQAEQPAPIATPAESVAQPAAAAVAAVVSEAPTGSQSSGDGAGQEVVADARDEEPRSDDEGDNQENSGEEKTGGAEERDAVADSGSETLRVGRASTAKGLPADAKVSGKAAATLGIGEQSGAGSGRPPLRSGHKLKPSIHGSFLDKLLARKVLVGSGLGAIAVTVWGSVRHVRRARKLGKSNMFQRAWWRVRRLMRSEKQVA